MFGFSSDTVYNCITVCPKARSWLNLSHSPTLSQPRTTTSSQNSRRSALKFEDGIDGYGWREILREKESFKKRVVGGDRPMEIIEWIEKAGL